MPSVERFYVYPEPPENLTEPYEYELMLPQGAVLVKGGQKMTVKATGERVYGDWWRIDPDAPVTRRRILICTADQISPVDDADDATWAAYGRSMAKRKTGSP